MLTKEARRHITGFELGQDGRLMVVGLNMAPRMLSLVTVYVPQSRRPEEERTGPFEELSKVVGRCAKKGVVMVMGDCNARIHGRLQSEMSILGPHTWGWGVEKVLIPNWGEGERPNRDLLMELCTQHDLVVSNTWFCKSEEKKVTYADPGVKVLPKHGEPWDPTIFAELDLCLVPARWKGMVKNVESVVRAGLNSDHFPLDVVVELRLRAGARRKADRPPKRDFAALDAEGRKELDDMVVELFNQAVAAQGHGSGEHEGLNGTWEALREAVSAAVERVVPEVPLRPRREWISA